MGCWDIYCFLCGCTTHSLKFDHEIFLENLELYKSNKGHKSFKTYFKPIYEFYQSDIKGFIKKTNLMNKNTKWLNNCTFLCADNKIIHGCKEINCNITFQDKNNNVYKNLTYYEDNFAEQYGVFIHTDCWKFIKKEYGINLNYSYLPIDIHDETKSKIFSFVNYGVIEKYWKQYFNFIQMIVDNNEELLISPLKSILVSNGIKKIFSKLKIRTDTNRKSPIVSATFYKPNTFRVGLDKNIWQVKVNKWIKCADTVKIKFSSPKSNVIKKTVLVGDYNLEPIFIINFTQNKKMFEYEILTTKEYLLKKYPNLIV